MILQTFSRYFSCEKVSLSMEKDSLKIKGPMKFKVTVMCTTEVWRILPLWFDPVLAHHLLTQTSFWFSRFLVRLWSRLIWVFFFNGMMWQAHFLYKVARVWITNACTSSVYRLVLAGAINGMTPPFPSPASGLFWKDFLPALTWLKCKLAFTGSDVAACVMFSSTRRSSNPLGD